MPSTLSPDSAGTSLQVLYDMLAKGKSMIPNAGAAALLPNGNATMMGGMRTLESLRGDQARDTAMVAARRTPEQEATLAKNKAAINARSAPRVAQAPVMGQPGLEPGPDEGPAALASLQGTAPAPTPTVKVGAKPAQSDLDAEIDKSIMGTIQANPEGVKPNMSPEDRKQLDTLLQPKPVNYKSGSDLDMKGVSGFKRFIGYSKTGDWRDADRKEMVYQIERAAHDRGDQSYTPQELQQLELLQGRSKGDDTAAHKQATDKAERLSQSQNQLREQALRNRGQVQEATVRANAQRTDTSDFQKELLGKYLDTLDPTQVKELTGMDVDPNVLREITAARGSTAQADPMKAILADYLQQTLQQRNPNFKPGGAPKAPVKGGAARPLELRALGE